MPAPIAPWMSASEALTIWMFSTAMKAPSVEPTTAIQVLSEAAGVAEAAGRERRGGVESGHGVNSAVMRRECGRGASIIRRLKDLKRA